MEDIVIDFNCVDANKEEYYARIEESNRQKMIEKMKVSTACGQDLVNIKFQPIDNNAALTKTTLFDEKTNNGKL